MPAVRVAPFRLTARGRWLVSVGGFALLVRAITIGALGISAARAGHPLSWAVTNFDGGWYAKLSSGGYPAELPTNPDGSVAASTAGFFPLFALTIRPLTALGLPFATASLILVTLSATAAAMLIAMVVRHYAEPRTAWLTAAAWSVFPTSGILSAAYSEALFTALAAGCLLALVRRNWILAGVLAALSGATRPTGVVVVAAVGVAVAVAVLRDHHYRSVWAALIAPWGTAAALLWIGSRAGRLDAWFVTESQGWGVHFDAGWTLFGWCADALRGRHGATGVVYVIVLAGTLAMVVLAACRRPPPPVLTYLVLGALLAIGQGGTFHLSGLRFLLPIFPLLVPVGGWLASTHRWFSAAVLAGAAAFSAGLACYYFTIGTVPP